MKQKKTIQVSDLREKANAFLLNSDDSQKGERDGVRMFVESVLMETGNYAGFGYLTPNQMKDSEQGASFGIDPNREQDNWFDGSDHTRVFYFQK